MSLTPGSRVGPYEVLQLLGEGGMGQVFRGRDTRLGRDVAIKVLPESVATDPERLARFEREAKLLASLSHTNIAQIYGLEDAGPRVLVMELAAGEDLTLRIKRGPIALEEALPIALQITHALEAAHDRAIVHRDLKPANIKVSEDGAVKVLDFGLAKAFSPADAASSSAMNSPTLTAQATAAGVILGTAAYMSPEQARGREADKRADVWAFGVVFFEMLTGDRLFQGETISDTLAAVLRQDIPWSSLPVGLPAEITRLLRRCLERDRKNRLHDIADARIVLEEVARGGGKDEAVPAAVAPPARTPWLMIGVATLAALAIGVAIGKAWTSAAPAVSDAATVRLTIKMPPGSRALGEPAVSNDGRFIVFQGLAAGIDRLYIQQLDEASPRALERTERGSLPFISPDGRWIGFKQGNQLVKIGRDGGEPLPITEVPTSAPGALWMLNGRILFAKSWLGGIFDVSAEGGAAGQISTLDTANGEIGHWFPSALPDEGHVLITVFKKGTGINDNEIAVLDLKTKRHTVLFKGTEGRYLAPGFIVFLRAGAFHAVRFDPVTLKPSGDPVRVLDDAYGNIPQGDTAQTDLSATGTIAYLSGPTITNRELMWVGPDGKATALGFGARAYSGASISADGQRLAVSLSESGRHQIRLIDLKTNREDPLELPGLCWFPRWHSDAKRLAYASMQKGDFDVYWKDVTSAAPPEKLLVTDFDEMPFAFFPKGDAVIVEQSNSEGGYRPMLLPLNPVGTPRPVGAHAVESVSVSPDGNWIAYVSSPGGPDEAYLVPATGGVPDRISTGGAQAVAWSSQQTELFYLRAPEIVAVSFRLENGRLRRVGERVWARVEGNYTDDVFQQNVDGRILVALSKDSSPREIRVVTNWASEIARKFK